MTLGEFRELTEYMSDDTPLIVAHNVKYDYYDAIVTGEIGNIIPIGYPYNQGMTFVSGVTGGAICLYYDCKRSNT